MKRQIHVKIFHACVLEEVLLLKNPYYPNLCTDLMKLVSKFQSYRPRNKPSHIQSINLWQKSQDYAKETVISIDDNGKTGQPHTKQWNLTPHLHY